MLLIGNGRVVTRDAQAPYFSDGAVAVSGETIAAVGPLAQLQEAYPQAEFLDARGGDYTVCAVTNGFHAFRTHLLLGKAGLTQNVLAAGEPPMLALSITNRIREAFSLVAAWIRY